MRYWLLTSLLILAPAQIHAQSANAGFVQGLWYDKAVIFVDTPVRMYTAVRNNTGSDLTGTVEFFVNGSRIERTSVQALDGRIIESWADWTPAFGTSTIRVTLSHTRISPVGSSTQAVEALVTESIDEVFVDFDTDGDGVGNRLDLDDDGDGILDTDDTEPLVFNQSDEEIDEEETEEIPESEDPAPSQSDEPAGLEQYLTDSPTENALSRVTGAINTSKERVDAYRTKRNEALAAEPETETVVATTTDPETGDISFGTITRSQVEPEEGFMKTIGGVFKSVWSSLYTATLFVLSVALGHPILMQILLLIVLLYLIYRLARYFGRRPDF